MTQIVALTGATGFIGRHIARRLVKDGIRVRALTRRHDEELAALGCELVPGSLEDGEALVRLVQGCTAIVHGAGAVKARNTAEFEAINIGGTESLARTVAETSPDARFILLSSLAARTTELSAYAASKRAAEQGLEAAGLRDWAIIRPPAVYGPGDRATLPLIEQLSRGLLVLPARPGARFSLLYVEDLAALIAHLLQEPEWNRITVEPDDGTKGGYDWASLADIASDHLGHRVRHLRAPFPLALALVGIAEQVARLRGTVPMTTTAKLRELYHPDWLTHASDSPALAGYKPRVAFRKGFAFTLAWYQEKGWIKAPRRGSARIAGTAGQSR